ncbi:hypothetical protein MNBD_ALPHA08-88 [hydrothermal vent metagenome]|uniref:Dienelactone hydrolase domain-containing protein n=1 Tax=hydrothermal vent metagenome TaxID=652676 RepID=A0A3B0SNU5_9ZZZZ
MIRSLFVTALTTAALVFSGSLATGQETDPQTVIFRGKPAPLTAFQKRRLPPGAKNPPGRELTAVLRIPKSDTPRPAVIMIHTCHDPAYYLPWIKRFNSWGLATLSFSRCQPPDNKPLNANESLEWREGSATAYAALNYLAANPAIDKKAIALIGWSRVGMVPLSVLNPEGEYQFSKVKFAATVAINPFCGFAGGPHQAPVLVLSGGKDDWVDAKQCQKMSVLTAQDKFPVTVKVYPDAWHGFDIEAFGKPHFSEKEINLDGYPAGGGTLGFNQAALEEAIVEVKDFLDKNLSP